MNYLAKRLEASKEHQDAVWDQGVNELDVVGVNGKRLTLADGRELTEFMSCSYLGLDQRPELRDAAHLAIDSLGVQMSAARTRMRAAPFRELDGLLAEINGGWKSVTFNSVSAAHMATIPILAAGELPGYTIAPGGLAFVIDRSAHASIQSLRGIMEQFGHTVRVDFQNMEEVTETCRSLSDSGQTVIALCDSVGSMGGGVDVGVLTTAIDELGGITYLDDAHGTSIFGHTGEGFVLASTEGHLPNRTIWTGSLSKAFGATGGFVALSNTEATSFIKRYSMPYAFGGPPSLPAIGAAVASAHLHLDGTVQALQDRLHENTALLDDLLASPSINTGTASPIRGVMIGDEFAAINASKTLHEHGYAVTAAMYPTVKMGQAILRLAVSASHSDKDIRGITEVLNKITSRQDRNINSES